MPKVYAYIRVSTAEQAASGMGLAAQERRALAYYEYLITLPEYKDFGWGGVYEEAGVSAYTVAFVDRPVGAKLHALLDKGDHVVFLRLDRAFRSVKDFLSTNEMWELRGVNAHFLDLGVDMSTANGRLTLHILASVAQWESDVKSERTKAALAERKIRNRKHCRHSPYGFRYKGKNRVAVPDFEELVVMRYICHLRDHRELSWQKIGNQIEAVLAAREDRKAKMEWDRRWKWQACQRAYKAWQRITSHEDWRKNPQPSFGSGLQARRPSGPSA
tara:strand:+ start:1118 stop:1936 length:819 start_codon:yes stop_codon:yes gene_type:complete